MKKIIIVVGIVIVLGGLGFFLMPDQGPGRLDGFAQCLKEKNAIFYGAFWCPHCQNQKKLFGSSAKYLPYVECSTPDGQQMIPACKEKNVKGYPTWDFADGSRLEGEVTLGDLAKKTGCALPTQ